MIKGIGIDIIEIERIEKAIKNNQRFLEKVFTDRYIGYFNNIGKNSNTIAGSFAAKEAVVKAMGTGIRGFKWTDVEIIRDELGKPEVVLYKNAKKIAEDHMITNIMVTISHSKKHAVAQAIALL